MWTLGEGQWYYWCRGESRYEGSDLEGKLSRVGGDGGRFQGVDERFGRLDQGNWHNVAVASLRIRMLVDTFEDVQKEYNAGEESCRVSLESRLRQDTFEALQALNAESWGGEDVPEIVQGSAEGKCAQMSSRAEGYSGEFDRVCQKRISPIVQETSQTAGQRGLRARQPTDVPRSWNYQQRTRITGEDPLSGSRGASFMRERGGGDSRVGRRHTIGPRSVDAYRSGQYWQKTTITGKDSLSVSGNTTHREQEDERFNPCRAEEERRGQEGVVRKRARLPANGQSSENGLEEQPRKQARTVMGEERSERNARQEEEAAAIMCTLEEEFEEKEPLSHGSMWCESVPHERKVSTVCEFYKAFHEARTLPIRACTICYRQFALVELEEFDCTPSMSTDFGVRYTQFSCRKCFPLGRRVLGCAECIRELERGGLSPAGHVHGWLRCEHTFPDELKDMTPVEEKLIALNSCYGFITKYSVVKGHRESTTYPKHIKGHITVFPNSVQELVTLVLPHPLLKVMDEIHVSWQGTDKPAPKDLSILLSVRRRIVEKALVWLRKNNPLYAHIEIDTAKLESWDAPSHGVPPQVYDRLERDKPSALEKTRTAQLVPPTERGLKARGDVDVREILAILNQKQDVSPDRTEVGRIAPGSGDAEAEANMNRSSEII